MTHPHPPIIRGVHVDCTCTTPRPHGTHHTYSYHGCGCDNCREGARLYTKRSRALAAQGLSRRRSSEPTRRRILLLKERGLTIQDIATQAGVSFVNLHLLLRDNRPTVTARTAAKVASVPIPPRHH